MTLLERIRERSYRKKILEELVIWFLIGFFVGVAILAAILVRG